MNKAIISVQYPQFAHRLQALGYAIIPSEEIPCEMPYERDHADLQCLILDDTAFVIKQCKRLSNALSEDYRVITCGESFSGKYPDNVRLSAVKLGKKLICRTRSLDSKVKEFCNRNSYDLIHVNQGYAKCSCAVISDNAIITADKGIYQALSKTDIEVLLIGEGHIDLCGTEYGFIGGASGYDRDNNTVYFCGNIEAHPDYPDIKSFCDKHQTAIISLTDDRLTDIGGIMFC